MTQEEIEQKLREDLSWVPQRTKDLFMINEDGSFKTPPPGPLIIDLSKNEVFLEYKVARQKRIAEITGEQYKETVAGEIEDYNEYLQRINSLYVKDERTDRSEMEQNQMDIFIKTMREKLKGKEEGAQAEETFPWEEQEEEPVKEERPKEERPKEEKVEEKDPKEVIKNLQQIFDSHEEEKVGEEQPKEKQSEEEQPKEEKVEEPKVDEPVKEEAPEEEPPAEEKVEEERPKRRSSKKKEAAADITVSHTPEEIQDILQKIDFGTTNADFRDKQKDINAVMQNIMITSDMPVDLARSKLAEISQLLNTIWYDKMEADRKLKAYIGKDGLYAKIAALQAEGGNETERRQSVNKFLMNYPLKDGTVINVLEIRASLEYVATYYQSVYDFLRLQQTAIQTYCGTLRTEAMM